MNDWINIDRAKLIDKGRSSLGDRDDFSVEVSLSPYDIPEYVRSYRDKDDLVIEFRYISNEETEDTSLTDYLTVSLGVESRRLYKIRIDALRAQNVVDLIEPIKELDDLSTMEATQAAAFDFKGARTKVTRSVINNYKEELLVNF